MANSAVVGVLRAMLTADTGQFDTSMRRSAKATDDFTKKLSGQAARMAQAFGGDKLLASANNLTAAIGKIGGAQKLTAAESANVNRQLSNALAKYVALGQQAPKAMLDLERATRRVVQPTDMLQGKMIALGAAVGTMLGTFVSGLAGRAVRGVIDLGKEAVESAGKFIDLSDSTGLSTESLQRMSHVAGQSGTTLEAMSDSAFKLGVRIAGGSDSVKAAVAALGIEWTKLQAMRPDAQFETVAGALGKVENAQERNRLGIELYGKSFSNIAAAVASGYAEMASQARVSTDAQLRALDKLGDEWDAFVVRQKSDVRSMSGMIVIALQQFNKMSFGEIFTTAAGLGATQNPAMAMILELNRLAAMAPKDIHLTPEDVTSGAAKLENFSAQLAKVRAELEKLTPAQRKEIEAAQQLGVSTDDLEDRYGLTSGALRILTTDTKGYKTAIDAAAKSTDDAAAAYRGFINFVEERRIEDIANEIKANADLTRADVTGLADRIELTRELMEARDDLAAQDRAYTNFLEERRMEAEGAAIKKTEELRREQFQRTQQMIRGLVGPLGDEFGALMVGLGQKTTKMVDGVEVEVGRMKTAFLDAWEGIRQGIARIISDILNDITGRLIKGTISAVAGRGFQSGFTGLAGGVAGIAGLGGGSAVAADVAGVAAAAGGGGGAAAGLGAFFTNPWTIGVGASILAAIGIKKFAGPSEAYSARELQGTWQRSIGDAGVALIQMLFNKKKITKAQLSGLFDPASREQFKDTVRSVNPILQASGGAPFVRPFNFGGFVPPNVTQPAILHGGSMGEMVVPLAKLANMVQQQERPSPSVTWNVRIDALDGADVKRVFESEILPRFHRDMQLNQRGTYTLMKKVFRP